MTGCQGAAGTGTLYSYAQLEGLWINAGGSSTLAPVMAAIAEAESGGCSTAQNPSGATGLWQILGAVNPADQNSLTDPAVNAKEAVLKYQSQGPGAWTTYTSGAYKAYLNGSTTPDTSVPAGGTPATTTAATATSTCVIKASENGFLGIGAASVCFFSKSEARALIGGLFVTAGFILGIAGAVILAAAAFRHTGAAAAVSQVRSLPVIP